MATNWDKYGNQDPQGTDFGGRVLTNCDCGARLTIKRGRICARCGCLNCKKCTLKFEGAEVCQGCLTNEEQAKAKALK